jgi:DNA repair protein SbcC/Rad50
MRILAIRGKNLASLAEAFEIDFEAEPIRSAGIFAITGPTGAGKTTLLDAICLALFDSLPRMDNADKSAAIGRVDGDSTVKVKYDDVRGILRHGAGAGYAEVDFSGQDGRRYRARWEVNRARNRASGNLQNQKMTLHDLASGALIGDKKTDTLHQIEKQIGLSFDQFRRSVLLAQGDFDTFIRAGSRDRAELLERLTGTEIYSRISQAAFARAKEEREALRDLETQLGTHRPLDEEARTAAEARVQAAKAAVDRVEAEKLSFDKARDWYDTRTRLEAQVAEADTALTQALEADQAVDGDRASLLLSKRAFALRAELEAAAGTEQKLVDAERALMAAVEAERQAIEARVQAMLVSHAAKASRDAQQAAYEAIGPELEQAQRLDTLLDSVRAEITTRKHLLDESILAQDEAGRAVAAVETALAAAHHQRETDGRWLADHQAVEGLSIRLEEIATGISERLTVAHDMASMHANIAQLEHDLAAAEASRQQQAREITALQAQEQALDERLAALRKIADTIDRTAIEARRDAIVDLLEALDCAQDAAENIVKARAGIVTVDEEGAQQHSLIDQACQVMAQVDAELPADLTRLEEARHSLDLSEAAGSEAAEHLRLALRDGQPCPVCGATEHPITAVDRLLKARVAIDRSRVAELEATITKAREGRTRAETQITLAREALQGISRRKSEHEDELQLARHRWRTSVADVLTTGAALDITLPNLPEDTAAGEVVAALSPFREVLDRLLVEVKNTITSVSQAEAASRKLASERETVRASLALASQDLVRLTAQEHAKTTEAATLHATCRGLEQHLAAVCSRLDMALAPVFPDWRTSVTTLGVAFIDSCRVLVEQWRECRQRFEVASSEIARLEADIEGKRATLRASEAAVGEVERQHGAGQGELNRFTAERLNVIGGQPVEDVRTAHRERLDAAERAWSEAETTRSQAEQVAAALSSGAISAGNALDMARREHDSAKQLLAEKLRAGEISRADAECAMARGEAWVAAEQARLDALHEAVTTARVTVAVRHQSIKDHDVAGRPEHTRDDITTGFADIEERRAKTSEEFIVASSVLHRDDQALTHIAEIKARLDERRDKARVWGQLDELIGAADGAKFRRFAQSLTLDHLIHEANRHLANLHPRYELQRPPGSDLILQVIDHNMADEVRGVHNLSGGERFLVSLALALGLASMSSSRGIKIDSLFIDEGFGALDSTNLAMAVSVLEQLQATGRRVGVISHVDELKERIAVKVEVFPVGSGRSIVQVVTA